MINTMNRKTFLATSLKAGAALTLGSTLMNLVGCAPSSEIQRPLSNLVTDPKGICNLPAGFTYKIISETDELMSDGNRVPERPDGMGCFAGPQGEIILVRNHEIGLYLPPLKSPFPAYAYDPDSAGGTTTVWLNENLEVTKQYQSLTGTIQNCCGGATPWGTWISSEEVEESWIVDWLTSKPHGYNFEVDPLQPLQKIKPLKAMGRFKHEAVAVDHQSGIAYQTEDEMKSCFYRFLPNKKQHFEEGGTLEALKFEDDSIWNTTLQALELGKAYPVEWVTIDQPDPKEGTVRGQGQDKGAAIFVRGEGISAHTDGIYFACTQGGAEGCGQIFKYVPSKDHRGGSIVLVFEAKKDGVLEKPDNLTLNKWGDLIICEDNSMDKQCLVGLTPEGKIYYIASNMSSEWAGACFSPDGKTLFANIHKPGITIAIQGPWEELRVA